MRNPWIQICFLRQAGQSRVQGLPLGKLSQIPCLDFWEPSGGNGVGSLISPLLFEIGKKGRQLRKILNSVWVILVVVAFGASGGCPHPNQAEIANPVGSVFGQIFLVLDATFVRGLQ